MPVAPESAGVSSEYGWAVPPPPPPPMMSSSELSSAGFSGPRGPALPPPHPAVALGFNQSSFTYDDLAAATGGFAQSNLLGQGGFGYVHKGILPNGKEIAPRPPPPSGCRSSDTASPDLRGCWFYEFIANNTLEYHLHGSGRPTMEWPTRLKIAIGAAKGFSYLHEDCHPRIIHRDIKAANILLDFNFEAKVADFGLAKLSSDNYTHVSTRIMGTFGYLAPEYAASGKLTEKSDVYSFGVVLLELITGRRAVDIRSSDDESLVDWARPILMNATEGGNYEKLVDPRLEDNYDPQEMLRMVASAAACDVSLDDLNEGVRPGHSAMFSSSSEYDTASNSDVKRFRKAGISSQEFTSSEHGLRGEFVHSGGDSQEILP
ncbi:Proline-rich receptor-like protein kinase PERK4 [Abeliophyllum distichum]|uniref:non-specific serine/threonine protein kinase n=1 Tax=Abeliophyllum distichum TaxID=126358 RepID=A0ABD1THJ9_9LAMI